MDQMDKKLLEENVGKKLLNILSWQRFFGHDTKNKQQKQKQQV